MPKRARQSDEEETAERAIKKQISVSQSSGIKIREIKSHSSEKTINQLFDAASKSSSQNKVSKPNQCSCPTDEHPLVRCYFCDKMICSNCLRPCDICREIFCENCSFLMYDEQYDCVCYSCMNNK